MDRAVQEAMRRSGEQAAREKAELQQSIRAQQEASERAAQDALKRANEQAARERAELQQSLKAQQAASDRAVAEAIKRSNEQAARERAELQQSMEKMLKEALARQNAALEAERAARGGGAPAPAAVAPAPAAAQPIQLASIAPSAGVGAGTKPSPQMLGALSNAPGDEWEYLATDEMFGKKQKLVLRVKAASAEGVLEEVIWNGRSVQDWVFGSGAAALGTPNESEFMFAPHWSGGEISDFQVDGGRGICIRFTCIIRLTKMGNEKQTTAAGTFDTDHFAGSIDISGTQPYIFRFRGKVEIWYSRAERRLVKQTAELFGGNTKYKETLELAAIRRAAR
jgi:hypothetical protein